MQRRSTTASPIGLNPSTTSARTGAATADICSLSAARTQGVALSATLPATPIALISSPTSVVCLWRLPTRSCGKLGKSLAGKKSRSDGRRSQEVPPASLHSSSILHTRWLPLSCPCPWNRWSACKLASNPSKPPCRTSDTEPKVPRARHCRTSAHRRKQCLLPHTLSNLLLSALQDVQAWHSHSLPSRIKVILDDLRLDMTCPHQDLRGIR